MSRFEHLRLPDWTQRWSEFIRDCQQIQSDLKLDWEHVNCTYLTGQGIEAITGHNPYDDWEGKFTTSQGAAKEIKKRGFETLDDVMLDLFPEVPLSMVWPGDVVLIRTLAWDGDEELRTVMPHGVALADPPVFWAITLDGMGTGPLYEQAVKALAVGREV